MDAVTAPAVPATRIAEIERLARAVVPHSNLWFPNAEAVRSGIHDEPADAEFIAACDPQTILALCALARGASEPRGALYFAGQRMANLLYNFAQKPNLAIYAQQFRDAYTEWDSAARSSTGETE